MCRRYTIFKPYLGDYQLLVNLCQPKKPRIMSVDSGGETDHEDAKITPTSNVMHGKPILS
eukprot:SAG31_NODE_610_length_13564_cov_3.189528_5_plen_60_part_00